MYLALILCVLFTLSHLQRLRDISRKKSDELNRLYSQMCWLGQHNADLVLKNIDANTKMTDLGARQQVLEEELARTASERDVQRAAVEQKAQEADAQSAELQRVRAALEQKEVELQHKEAELQHEKATIATLSGTLEVKEVAIRNAEAALKEKEDSLSSLEEAARVQQEEAQKNIAGEGARFRYCWILIYRSLSWFH